MLASKSVKISEEGDGDEEEEEDKKVGAGRGPALHIALPLGIIMCCYSFHAAFCVAPRVVPATVSGVNTGRLEMHAQR